MGLVILMVMLYGRFLPSVGMTVILKEKKCEEVWAATPPTLPLLSPSCGRHSDRREESITVFHCCMVELWEESITVFHRLLPLLFFPREGGWGDELVWNDHGTGDGNALWQIPPFGRNDGHP